jgi:hypothetical protein
MFWLFEDFQKLKKKKNFGPSFFKKPKKMAVL